MVTSSYTPPITVKDVSGVPDIKALLDPCMAGPFYQHSRPHWFRFTKVEDKVYMHYKMWLNDPWEPASPESPGLVCLKAYPDSDATPDWVEPNLEKLDWDKLTKDLPNQYNSCLPQHAKIWWSQFLNALDQECSEVPTEKQVRPVHSLKGGQHQQEPELGEVLDIVQVIEERVDAVCAKVTIGNQGKQVRGVMEVDNFQSVTEGMVAAIYMEEKKGRPFIGRVTAINVDEVTIHWWRGAWTGEFREWNTGVGKNSKPYESVVPKLSLLMWDFQLTRKNHLSKETVLRLKKSYEDADKK